MCVPLPVYLWYVKSTTILSNFREVIEISLYINFLCWQESLAQLELGTHGRHAYCGNHQSTSLQVKSAYLKKKNIYAPTKWKVINIFTILINLNYRSCWSFSLEMIIFHLSWLVVVIDLFDVSLEDYHMNGSLLFVTVGLSLRLCWFWMKPSVLYCRLRQLFRRHCMLQSLSNTVC